MFLVRNDPPLTFPAFPVIPVSVHLAFRQLLQDGFSGLLLNLLLTGLLDLRLHKRFLDFCQSVLHDPLDFGNHSIQTGGSGDTGGLTAQIQRLMAPYLRDGGFYFQGVTG